jgi:hypothetical protein
VDVRTLLEWVCHRGCRHSKTMTCMVPTGSCLYGILQVPAQRGPSKYVGPLGASHLPTRLCGGRDMCDLPRPGVTIK